MLYTTHTKNTMTTSSPTPSPSLSTRSQSFSTTDKPPADKPPAYTADDYQEIGKGIVQATSAANQTAVTVQRNIWANENPHPAVVIGVSVSVVCLVCLAFYISRPAPLTGEWYDSKGQRYYFKQTGQKVIVVSQGKTQHATFIENIFKMDDNIGLYDFHGVIKSVSGVSFYKTVQ